MKNILRITAIVAILGLSAVLVGSSVYSNISAISRHNTAVLNTDASSESSRDQNGCVAAMNQSESLVFDTIDEYKAYLLEQQGNEGAGIQSVGQNSGGTVTYLAPEAVPEDAELVSIIVNDEGTLFDYELSRPAKQIIYNSDDETIDALLHTMTVKEYNYDNFSKFVSDFRTYAANLANDIDAVLVSSDTYHDRYVGSVFANVTVDGVSQGRILIGTQTITWRLNCGLIMGQSDTSPETLIYHYYPAIMSESEIEQFTNIIEYPVD